MAQEFTDIALPGWEVVHKLGEGSAGWDIHRRCPGEALPGPANAIRERKRIALMKLLGIPISARTQRGKSKSAETGPVKIHVMAAAEDLKLEFLNGLTSQHFWGQTEYLRSDVKTVTFRGTLDGAPDSAWDVSEAKDRSILAWMESGNLFVAANGKISPNPDASWLFADFENATAIDFGNCFDTSEVTYMSRMFYGCSSLKELDLSGFDTSKVTNMYAMFYDCGSMRALDVSGLDTSEVTNMGVMFSGCGSLRKLDISGLDTSKVTSMCAMFFGCSSLRKLDASGFDTAKVTEMSGMFSYCSSLRALDVSGFDTAKVTRMYGMFSGCSSLRKLDVSGFDTSKVTDMERMFSDCSSLGSIRCTNESILAEYKKR